MKDIGIIVFWIAIGYVGSCFSWPWLHTRLIGAEQMALNLRDQARALEAKLRGK